MFDLARVLGKSIREIEAFDSAELSEWLAYYRLDKDDKIKADLERGALAAQASAKNQLKGVLK